MNFKLFLEDQRFFDVLGELNHFLEEIFIENPPLKANITKDLQQLTAPIQDTWEAIEQTLKSSNAYLEKFISTSNDRIDKQLYNLEQFIPTKIIHPYKEYVKRVKDVETQSGDVSKYARELEHVLKENQVDFLLEIIPHLSNDFYYASQ